MSKDKIKSLEKKLKALRSKPDKGARGREKVDILNELAYAVRDINPRRTYKYAKKALLISKKLNYEKGISASYTYIGISCDIQGDHKEALKYQCKALKLKKDIGDKNAIASSYLCVGNALGSLGDYEKATRYYLKSLQLYEKIGDKSGIASACLSIGSIYGNQKDFGISLKYKLRALELYEQIGDKLHAAITLNNIGCVYEMKGDYGQALDFYQKSLNVSRELKDRIGIAFAYANIGLIYEDQKIYDRATDYYSKALKIFVDSGRESDAAHVCIAMSRSLCKCGRYNDAHSHLQRGIDIARKIGNKDCEIEGYDALSSLYEEQQMYKKALEYYKKYTNLKERVYDDKKSKQIAEMRTKYETERKEKEAEIYQLKNVKLRQKIEERKKAEKELKKHRDQLEELVAERTAQLRSLAHELSLVEEKQRRKIATFLHDEINQKLALAAFRLDALEKVKAVTKIKKEQKDIKKIIDQAAQFTRSLTFEISPPVLYEFGLEAAIEWLVRQFSKQYRIPCKFKDDGKPKPVTDDTRILLFQSVRELLANISKHARANSVTVFTTKKNNVIRIKVKDDGVGFDTRILNEKIAHNEGFGLFNIMERLQHMRGQLEIKSTKGSGTSAVIVAPLQRVQRRTSKEG